MLMMNNNNNNNEYIEINMVTGSELFFPPEYVYTFCKKLRISQPSRVEIDSLIRAFPNIQYLYLVASQEIYSASGSPEIILPKSLISIHVESNGTTYSLVNFVIQVVPHIRPPPPHPPHHINVFLKGVTGPPKFSFHPNDHISMIWRLTLQNIRVVGALPKRVRQLELKGSFTYPLTLEGSPYPIYLLDVSELDPSVLIFTHEHVHINELRIYQGFNHQDLFSKCRLIITNNMMEDKMDIV